MLRTTRISLEHKEFRRDRRYSVPAVSVITAAGEHRARNWSLGGLLLDRAPGLAAGGQVAGQLRVGGRSDSFDVTAEVVRRNTPEGTIACRFVDPSPAMVSALDGALAARLLGRRTAARAGALGVLAAAALLMAAPQALAASGGGGALVPGGFPLPEFRLNFPDLLAGPPPMGPSDLKISLTSPDKSVLQFLFSPRSQFGFSTDRETGTSRSYAGLSWNLFENSGFFGNLDLSGSFTRPGATELYRNDLGPPLALHSTFEFGYQLGAQHSLTLSLDHATAPDLFGDRYDNNNLRLRYGLKF
jgi:hypothetical protein